MFILLTGLPGAGKSTLCAELHKRISDTGTAVVSLDGDRIRAGLCSDLGYSREDRRENCRRVAELGRLLIDNGVVAVAAMIAPYRDDRHLMREIVGTRRFLEVFCNCPPDTCERRDPKGHYASARSGLLPGFTGVSAPYEPPRAADLVLDTAGQTIQACTDQVLRLVSAPGDAPPR